jgi:hypothetical protein
MHLSLSVSDDIIEFHTTDMHSSLDLTNVVYNVSIQSREEKLYVM